MYSTASSLPPQRLAPVRTDADVDDSYPFRYPFSLHDHSTSQPVACRLSARYTYIQTWRTVRSARRLLRGKFYTGEYTHVPPRRPPALLVIHICRQHNTLSLSGGRQRRIVCHGGSTTRLVDMQQLSLSLSLASSCWNSCRSHFNAFSQV